MTLTIKEIVDVMEEAAESFGAQRQEKLEWMLAALVKASEGGDHPEFYTELKAEMIKRGLTKRN